VLRPEKLLIVKERYLLLSDYDMVKAELLSTLDSVGDWVSLCREDMQNILSLPISKDHLTRKIRALVEAELIEVDKTTRPHRYRVVASVLEDQVRSLDLQLVENTQTQAIINIDDLGALNRVLIYADSDKVSELDRQNVGLTENRPRKCRPKSKLDCENVGLTENRPTKCRPNHELDRQNVGLKIPLNSNILSTNDLLSTSEELTESTTSEELTESTTDVKNSSNLSPNLKSAQPKNRFYDWTHYAKFTPEDWDAAKADLTMPGKERPQTMLLGAYLLGLHTRHGIDLGLVPQDFNGKYGRSASAMLTFFTDANAGDAIAGFNKALEWIREFLTAPKGSYPERAGYPIAMCFGRDSYRYAGQTRYQSSDKKINDTGTVVMGEAARAEALKQGRVFRGKT